MGLVLGGDQQVVCTSRVAVVADTGGGVLQRPLIGLGDLTVDVLAVEQARILGVEEVDLPRAWGDSSSMERICRQNTSRRFPTRWSMAAS